MPLDEINTGDEFRDRVFHLQARVHLHEEELVTTHDQFNGASPLIMTAAPAFNAASYMDVRMASDNNGAGASSITFW